MALETEKTTKRVHESQVIKVMREEREGDVAAQARIDKLLFDYILRYPERLKKWLDQGKHAD